MTCFPVLQCWFVTHLIVRIPSNNLSKLLGFDVGRTANAPELHFVQLWSKRMTGTKEGLPGARWEDEHFSCIISFNP